MNGLIPELEPPHSNQKRCNALLGSPLAKALPDSKNVKLYPARTQLSLRRTLW